MLRRILPLKWLVWSACFGTLGGCACAVRERPYCACEVARCTCAPDSCACLQADLDAGVGPVDGGHPDGALAGDR